MAAIEKGENVMHALNIKRAYEKVNQEDGMRILVDRLWPRGIKKEDAQIDKWLKEISPSDEVRKSFHEEKDFCKFSKNYRKELKSGEGKVAVEELLRDLEKNKITLIYSAKDEKHNNAVVLETYLQEARRNK